jgi:hypothetical protein
MRKYLPHLISGVLAVALVGCTSGGSNSNSDTCSVAVGKGNTGTYTDGSGVQHQVTADDNGNVSVPCSSKDSLSMLQPTPSPDDFLM